MPDIPASKKYTDAVADLIANARARVDVKRNYSNIVDDEGNQYVDLVMGGGGVLGIALVGYTYALEELGIRFLGLGGTSAGSINALGLAAFGPPAAKKSDHLIAALSGLDLWKLVDGPNSARSVTLDFLKGRSWLHKAIDIAREYSHFTENLGLNDGTYFLEWLKGLMAAAGCDKVDALHAQLHQLPTNLHHKITKKPFTKEDSGACIKLIATDVTTGNRAIFPEMAKCYWDNPGDLNPAHFVRASMSIPFFFQPYRVPLVPSVLTHWPIEFVNPPEEFAFVDGGVLSNFPIDIFHDITKEPDAPTFGVKLGLPDQYINKYKYSVEFGVSIFNSARNAMDNDFIRRNPDYSKLVCSIDTGAHHWLNFDLSTDDRIDLFRRGVAAAIQFLDGFDWKNYLDIRINLAKANTVSQKSPPAASS